MGSGPVISLITAHGRQVLEPRRGERVIDLLRRTGVPWSGVSIYKIPQGGGAARLEPCLDLLPDEIGECSELLVYLNRNVNPFLFALNPLTVVQAEPAGGAAAEYVYQDYRDSGPASAYLKKLSAEECRAVVRDKVAAVIGEHVPRGSRLVVGVSGGGDSNALLDALAALAGEGPEVHPLIIKGIPEWDFGVDRARSLCADFGFDLTVVEEAEVKELLGVPQSRGLAAAFEQAFPGDDFEFLGTLLVRLALFKRARELGTSHVCTGLNLEDVLCENLFRLSSGARPASAPARQIGDMQLIFPLWLCPKRIIDGCFPRHSLANYDERYPCLSTGRNLYYSIVYGLQSGFPAFAEQLARGLSVSAAQDPVRYQFDEDLGFHVERFVPFPLRQRFARIRA